MLQPAQMKQPIMQSGLPLVAWEKVGCDLFECNHTDYIIVVEYYSDFFEAEKLSGKTTIQIIRKLKPMFMRHGGLPIKLVSDNCLPFNSE